MLSRCAELCRVAVARLAVLGLHCSGGVWVGGGTPTSLYASSRNVGSTSLEGSILGAPQYRTQRAVPAFRAVPFFSPATFITPALPSTPACAPAAQLSSLQPPAYGSPLRRRPHRLRITSKGFAAFVAGAHTAPAIPPAAVGVRFAGTTAGHTRPAGQHAGYGAEAGNGVVYSAGAAAGSVSGLPSVVRRRSLCRQRAGACPQLAAGTSDMEAKGVQLEEVDQEAPAPQPSLGRLLQTEPQQPRKQQRTGYPVLPQLVRAAGRNSDGGSSNASRSGDAHTTNVSGAATSGSSAGDSNKSSAQRLPALMPLPPPAPHLVHGGFHRHGFAPAGQGPQQGTRGRLGAAANGEGAAPPDAGRRSRGMTMWMCLCRVVVSLPWRAPGCSRPTLLQQRRVQHSRSVWGADDLHAQERPPPSRGLAKCRSVGGGHLYMCMRKHRVR